MFLSVWNGCINVPPALIGTRVPFIRELILLLANSGATLWRKKVEEQSCGV